MNGRPDGLACEFFWTFARFEYALKVTGFYRHNRNYVAPDWKRFGESAPVRGVLDDPVDAGLTEAIDYILNHPPREQAVENGGLVWRDRRPDADSQSGRVIELVCRVRNNLFHGGKGNPHNPERNEQLLGHSLIVLHRCLDASEEVAGVYHQDERQA